MGDAIIREKRVGIVKVPGSGAAPSATGQAPGKPTSVEDVPVAYADRHYQRAR